MALEFLDYIKTGFPKLTPRSVEAVLELHKEGATIPFMARYRKEKTGNLDEVEIRNIIESHELYNELIKRQAYMIKEIESQGNLTDVLKQRIQTTYDLGELEEIYRPYKKKKKTKATIAREAGIEPLADWLWALGQGTINDTTAIEVKAKEYLNVEQKFVTYDHCLQGAQNILVERLANDLELRRIVREDTLANGILISKSGKGFKPKSKYETYADYKEPIKNLNSSKTSHRYLAIRRGWQEGELTVTIEGSTEKMEALFVDFILKNKACQAAEFLDRTAKQALAVNVLPSIVNEIHRQLKDVADQHAIEVFTENVRQVLMSSPFGAKCVLGVDPGIRTGAKIALIDKGGNYISDTVFKLFDDNGRAHAAGLLKELLSKVELSAIAVGNGTAGRETEKELRKIMVQLEKNVPIVLVNESGASIYSASETARDEFPELDLTVRGAISIARRLQDPLSELVKIDPKSIGVGQYQHDVNQALLKKGLDFVVESCVNKVGVDLNTASPYLLKYISGIGPAVAKNIADYRKQHGLFQERDALLKVPNFTTKTYEQSAGFLRILNGKNALDATGIHPERYSAVREMANEMKMPLSELMKTGIAKLRESKERWSKLVGEFTFEDILRELESPGRDPRDPYKVFAFRDDIFELTDVKEGMICPGIVTNVTNFGAFVDIGVHQDGLVHISELTHKFVDDPKKVVKPGDQVEVKVLAIDAEKKQISLTMKLTAAPVAAPREPRPPRNLSGDKSGGQDSRGPRPNRTNPRDGDQRPRNDQRAKHGSDQRGPDQRAGGRKPDQRGRDDRPKKDFKPKPSFNNPFAALGDLKTQVKK
jgi:uncharacterized protein